MNIQAIRYAVIGLCGVAIAAAPLRHADAWMRAGAWGGHAVGGAGGWAYAGPRGSTAWGGAGSWHANGFRGGSAAGTPGSWSATGYRGGTASGGAGSWHATGAYGNTASGGYAHYQGGYYAAYHPPVVVNHYAPACYNCGGWNTGGAWAAGVAGVAAGAAIGAAAANANTATAAANAYAAGVATGAAARPAYVLNDIYPALPAGCAYSSPGGLAYYQCGATWFSPYYGANGVYYRVVAGP
jgi:hypothetical protein